jgi:hypothetical protein
VSIDIGWREAEEIEQGPDGKRELCKRHGIAFKSNGQPDYDGCCSEPECTICGIIACPMGEPLHFHHDGCPVRDCEGNVTFPTASQPTKGAK